GHHVSVEPPQQRGQHQTGRRVGVVHRDTVVSCGVAYGVRVEVAHVILRVPLLNVVGVVDAAYLVQVDAAEVLSEEEALDLALGGLIQVQPALVEELYVNYTLIEWAE